MTMTTRDVIIREAGLRDGLQLVRVPVATAFRALTRQLTQRLRVDRGLGYEIGGEYMPVGPERALVNAWATCLPEATRDVQQVVLDEAFDDIVVVETLPPVEEDWMAGEFDIT